MKRLGQAAIVVTLLAVAVGAARADICARPEAAAPARPQVVTRQTGDGRLRAYDALGLATLAPRPVVAPPDALATLPDEPASVQLLLCGLGSLGAWHIGRSAKNFHLFHVPEWYHAEGPAQIGHAVAANPDLSGALTPCTFDAPNQEDPVLLLFYRRLAPPSIFQSQCILTSEAPRGPPVCS